MAIRASVKIFNLQGAGIASSFIEAAPYFSKAESLQDWDRPVAAELTFTYVTPNRFLKHKSRVSELHSILITRPVRDTASAQETTAKTIGKGVSDNSHVSDTLVASVLFNRRAADQGSVSAELFLVFNKPLSDSSSVSESSVFDAGKNKTDATSASDAQENTVGKNQVDDTTVSDTPRLNAVKRTANQADFSEGHTTDITKTVTDTATATDDLDGNVTPEDDHDVSFTKVKSNRALVTEAFSRTVNYIRNFTDTPLALAQLNVAFTKILSDSSQISESSNRSATKVVTEQPSVAESFTVDFTKPLSDSGTAAESAALELTKPFLDQSDLSDNIDSIDVIKAITESPSFSESVNFSVSTALADQPSILDTPAIVVSTPLSNSGIISTAYSATPTKIFNDPASFSTSGEIVSQGYCDLTYFSEDYVGTRRTI